MAKGAIASPARPGRDGFVPKLREWLLFAAAVLGLLLLPLGSAQAFETTAPTAILVDSATGRVLYEKNADEEVPPASLAKLMTVAVIFDALKKGTVTRDQTFEVSEYAWRTGGAPSGSSTMFLKPRTQVSLDDLIKGIIIQSGNDATIVAAEGIAGSVEAFVADMNAEAKKIGLTHSHFTNPSGLPDPDLHVTMRDLVRLAGYLINTFPEEYHLFSEESFKYNGINQRNRNPLLSLGADGLKTGHTSEAGYGLVASAKNDGRRVVFAMSGMKSPEERAREAKRLMDYGLQDFEEVTLIEAGKPVGEVRVRDGTQRKVALVADSPLRLLVPRGSLGDVDRTIVDNGPLEAPVRAGQRVGWARFAKGDETVRQVPLYAAEAVPRENLIFRIGRTVAGHLTWHAREAKAD
ncbi:D-alanyl-D-alanine carboxypeptidase family protein [Aurantimonas sp. VKM B-3413]|uniref:D-alanyl-D-alanine carboxypeptidase family protein n=1 Tax=Aurantimonas sp. VKM B-3413 TaxID=2779401 RepID=UPI001E459559|nr:D-alanyl-D-alanine carboxypeptidase family protein [Aurantimonas sp. VKM B-3413]MCB8838117.1 D-alanyl-D-alanine carboxypeptidase [Aurantimonas sp. VKM B-3413]